MAKSDFSMIIESLASSPTTNILLLYNYFFYKILIKTPFWYLFIEYPIKCVQNETKNARWWNKFGSFYIVSRACPSIITQKGLVFDKLLFIPSKTPLVLARLATLIDFLLLLGLLSFSLFFLSVYSSLNYLIKLL